MRPTLAPTIDILPDGVLMAELATPFPVGPVNCYLLVDHPVTLVDPGMLWDDTPERIIAFLAGAGLTVADVEQVVVTHGHPDHFGAAGWVARESGAPVVCGRGEAPKLLAGFGSAPGFTHRLSQFIGILGVPDEVRDQFPTFLEMVVPMIHELGETDLILLDDHDTLVAGGRRWQVHVTPGHAVGHVSLFDDETTTLLAGDHLLARITPNPLIEPDADVALGRRRSLVEYLASLDRFVGLDPAAVLPGHGPAFHELDRWARAVREHHERRASVILGIVKDLGAPTPFELSQRLFPHLEGFSHMLGISEVVGHLDVLLETGDVCSGEDVPVRYAAT